MADNINDLKVFVVVARTGSFTKAANELGVSTSAVSHLIKNLENRLQTKLFNRTTRSIATTEAGEKLYRDLLPLFDGIKQSIERLSEFNQRLSGTLRINGADFAFLFAVWDKLERFGKLHPDVTLELDSDQRFVDIVANRFDAGIRLGGTIDKDMIAVRISPDLKMCVVASPDYWAAHGKPLEPQDLFEHNCLTFRQPTSGGIMPWHFRHPETGESLDVRVKGSVIVSSGMVVRRCANAGLGVIWTFEASVREELADGRLVKVLDDWTTTEQGMFLYFPNRNQHSPLMQALVGVLKE